MDDAFKFAKNNGGLPTEADYPYTSGSTGSSGSCQKSGHTMVSGSAPTGFVDVKTGSVDALASAVAQQPVSIAIQANQRDFKHYKSGVLTGTCGKRLDHGVLAVGYGVWTDGTPYWKVKNSWGPGWGMNGYVLIEKSTADKCGVLDAPSYPTL
jgi:KDEL-tailed cysteine endopeptidase